MIMEKAVRVPFKSVQELAEMWIEWAELELRNDNFDEAVKIMAKATQAPKRSTVDYFDETLTPQQRVHKSWKLWSFYVDLVESVSTLEETRAVYERIFELRIATPQTVVNYANLLEENKYFEESFKVCGPLLEIGEDANKLTDIREGT
jgi:pre-mRNA-splicing factor SYF1